MRAKRPESLLPFWSRYPSLFASANAEVFSQTLDSIATTTTTATHQHDDSDKTYSTDRVGVRWLPSRS